ncbi:hypothetical protein chiPu_0028138 [Chiloscyllium punctatum]|uniref:Uncharacterized protein n=1 Tax=Chiloscyllium punctatum TaxID=137246 RepID=A0A401TMY6_CHIPU|nr:hypothetical protein [Chiloscyllium punctatum]
MGMRRVASVLGVQSLVRKIVAGVEVMINYEVEPFASLSEMVRESVPRVLFNQDVVGSITRNPLRVNDVVELGDIVSGVKKFSELLGWHEEVNDLLATEHEKVPTLCPITNCSMYQPV